MAKPQNYDELYPGRFLKAPLFKGKNVTLTITDVVTEALAAGEEKEDDGEPPKTVLSFKETKMQLVIPKTNGFCIMQMFGKRLADWVGKRVVFFPTTTKFGPGTVDCIRVFGSPDIASDLPVVVPQGRRKPLKMTLHAVKAGTKPGEAQKPPPPTAQQFDREPTQDITDAWVALGWTKEEGMLDWARFTGSDRLYMAQLNQHVDEMNARETV